MSAAPETPIGLLNPPKTDALTRELRAQLTARKQRAEDILLGVLFETMHEYHAAFGELTAARRSLEDFEEIVGRHERT